MKYKLTVSQKVTLHKVNLEILDTLLVAFLLLANRQDGISQAHTGRGIQGGRRRPQAARPQGV
jgi:hypothetical protein